MKPCILCLIIVCMCTATVAAQEIEVVEPESVGLSSERLNEGIERVIKMYMEDKLIPGAVVLVARHGKIAYLKAFGKASEDKPLTTDAIFRWKSMTKTVVGAAVMQLVDRGKILLSDPISRYLPEFKQEPNVAQFDEQGEMTGLEPAKREITVHDLLTMTSGFSSPNPNYAPLGAMYQEAGLKNISSAEQTLAEIAGILARMPLIAQPGEQWHYSPYSALMLVYLVETVSGMRFEAYAAANIFEPLGMVDTGALVPKEKQDRITGLYYAMDGKNGKKGDVYVAEPGDVDLVKLPFLDKLTYFHGGGALSGTAYDYFRFAQMLLNGGRLDGAHILSPQAVKTMTQNHIADVGNGREPFYGHGWGYMMDVQQEDAPEPIIGVNFGGKSAYGWSGFTCTHYVVNPAYDTVVIIMSHAWQSSTMWLTYAPRIPNVVNGAIIE